MANETSTTGTGAVPAGMVRKTAKGVASQAHGRPLKSYKQADGKPFSKTLAYNYEHDEFVNEDAMVAAGEALSLKEQLKVVNAALKTTARQNANAAAILAAGIVKPDALNDGMVRLTMIYDGLYASNLADGMDEESAKTAARELASTLAKVEWPADED